MQRLRKDQRKSIFEALSSFSEPIKEERMNVVAGIDPSLTGTGIVILSEGEIVEKKVIKSKPSGKAPLAEIERLLEIKARVKMDLEKYNVTFVLIEGMSYMSKKTRSIIQLAALNYIIREYLAIKRIPFIVVAPSTLKKFVTGKGIAHKEVMLLETYKRFGETFTDNNACDAFALAKCGSALLGEMEKLTKPQKEVIKLLEEQRETFEIA